MKTRILIMETNEVHLHSHHADLLHYKFKPAMNIDDKSLLNLTKDFKYVSTLKIYLPSICNDKHCQLCKHEY